MKKALYAVLSTLMVLSLGTSPASAEFSGPTIEVKVTNITRSIIFTPPIIATSRRQISLFKLGEEPTQALADLAEGGVTDGVAEILAEYDADIIQDDAPLLPGESRIYHLPRIGARFVTFGSMLLPTNDGFSAFSVRLNDLRDGKGFRAYDAGSEENTEVCADIPGPQCDGTPLSEGLAEGYITPHAGIAGEAELSTAVYNWGEPVLWVEFSPFGFDE